MALSASKIGEEFVGDVAVETIQHVLEGVGAVGGIAGFALAPILKTALKVALDSPAPYDDDEGVADAFYTLARELDSRGKTEEAAEKLAAAARMGHVPSLLSLGLQLKASDPDEAKALFERAAERGSAEAKMQLALIEYDTNPQAAKAQLEDIAAAGKKWAMVLLLECLLKEGSLDQAEEYFNDNVQEFVLVDDAQLRYRWVMAGARTFAQKGEKEAAYSLLRPLAYVGDDNAGIAYAELVKDEDPEEARAYLIRAMTNRNTDACAYLARLMQETDVIAALELYWQGLMRRNLLARTFLQEFCGAPAYMGDSYANAASELIKLDLARYPGEFMSLVAQTEATREGAQKKENCEQVLAYLESRRFKPNAPVVAKTPALNDPCPCGSGKKFRHCCGKKDE